MQLRCRTVHPAVAQHKSSGCLIDAIAWQTCVECVPKAASGKASQVAALVKRKCWCFHMSILCLQAIGVYQQAARLPDAGPAASSKASALSKQLQRQRAQARKASRPSSFNFAGKEDTCGRADVAKKPTGRKGAAQATPNGHTRASNAGAADGAGRIGQAPVTGVISNDEEYEAAKQQAVSLQMAPSAVLETATLPCTCSSSMQCKLSA